MISSNRSVFGVKVKYIAYFFMILLLLGGIGKFFAKIAKIFGFGPSQDDRTAEQMSRAVQQINVNYAALTKDFQAYELLANQLENAMQGIGTKEKLIISLLTPLNADELKQVVKSFGVRKNDYAGFMDYTGDLFVWLNEEFEGWIMAGYRKQLQEIFAKTGLWI